MVKSIERVLVLQVIPIKCSNYHNKNLLIEEIFAKYKSQISTYVDIFSI